MTTQLDAPRYCSFATEIEIHAKDTVHPIRFPQGECARIFVLSFCYTFVFSPVQHANEKAGRGEGKEEKNVKTAKGKSSTRCDKNGC